MPNLIISFKWSPLSGIFIPTRGLVCAVIWLCCLDFLAAQSGNGEEDFVFPDDPVEEYATDSEFKSSENPVDPVVKQDLDKLADVAGKEEVRQFHQVLEDLLIEFGYDIKTGQLKGMNNLSVRRVTVSDAIPSSYKKFLSLLVAERIKKNAAIRVVQCITCQVKNSTLLDGKMIITSPVTDLSVLQTMAERLGIEFFIDVMLVYHTTHMVIGFEVFKASNQELVWAKSYNSESVKSRYQKLAIDYSQIASSRASDEYEPEYRFMFGFGGGGIPNVAGEQLDSTMLALQFRGTEKFDRRRAEFGMIFSVYLTVASVLSEYPVQEGTGDASTEEVEEEDTVSSDFIIPAEPAPFTAAVGLFGLYGHNFLPTVESYDDIRHGVHFGLGAMLASGYIAPALKVGWDVFFGKSYTFTLTANYMAPAKIYLGGETIDTAGGAGAVGVLSYNF